MYRNPLATAVRPGSVHDVWSRDPLAAFLTIDTGDSDKLLLDSRLSRSRREEVSKRMYKTELTKKVAVETRLSRRAVSDVINATLEKIQWALRPGDKVTFPGFGTFYTRH
jgi:hypothetical protein